MSGCVNFLHGLQSHSLDQSICHPSHLKKAHSSNATARETKIHGNEHAPIHMQRKSSPSLLTTMYACIHTGVRNKTIYTHVSTDTHPQATCRSALWLISKSICKSLFGACSINMLHLSEQRWTKFNQHATCCTDPFPRLCINFIMS